MTDSTTAVSQIGPAIDVIATKLKVPAQFVWGILERQAYVEFFTALVLFAGTITVELLLWKWYKKILAADPYFDEVGFIVGGVVVGVFVLIAFVCVAVTLGGAINPQYYALHQIISVIK